MKILICPDKFKGSLTARAVCNAVAQGLQEADPNIKITSVPLADGGEGTCALLTEWSGGREIELQVHGPLFVPVPARYGISKDGDTAFIEMASASGLTLLRPEERNPLLTSTLGTGELIADALQRRVKKIVMGIGGSATNDAGIGMASALGYVFYDVDHNVLKPIGENLIHIHHIETDFVHPLLRSVEVIALCDVTNPLYGAQGAAYVYGPQKGASQSAVLLLDDGLRNFHRVVSKALKTSVDFAGAGAAGGLGGGAKAFLNASMVKGINYIIEHTHLEEKVKSADLVITGEGKIDSQTFSGKVVSEVIRLTKSAGKPVLAICGQSELSENMLSSYGLDSVISLVDNDTSAESAVQNSEAHIKRKIKEAFTNFISR